MKPALIDWRGPGKWGKKERQRRCDLASISNSWTERPINRDFMKVCLVASAAGYLEPVNNQDFNALSSQVARDEKLDLLPDGTRLALWTGDQTLYAWNLALGSSAERFAEIFADSFSWADGIHIDYFTNPMWLLEARVIAGVGGQTIWNAMTEAERSNAWKTVLPWATTAWWQDWDAGLRLLVSSLRLLRPEWMIVGQQYHYTAAVNNLNGLFLEEYPTRSTTMDAFDADTARMSKENGGRVSGNIVEIRTPYRHTSQQLDTWKAWVESKGYYLAWGRDAYALVGL